MNSAALFDLLPDFGPRPRRVEQPAAVQEPQRRPDAAPLQPDAATLVAVARAEQALEARLALAHRAALEAAVSAAVEAERQAHAEEATAFMESLGENVGRTIGGHVDAMEARVSDLVGATVARIVSGLISDDLQKRSLVALAAAIREAVGDAEAIRIGIRGPLSLFEPLKSALGARTANLDFAEAPGFDLTVTIDDAVFETRMSEWSASLAEVLS